jgi:hypothetical protein
LPANHEWYDFTNNLAFVPSNGRFILEWNNYFKGGKYQKINSDVIG